MKVTVILRWKAEFYDDKPDFYDDITGLYDDMTDLYAYPWHARILVSWGGTNGC